MTPFGKLRNRSVRSLSTQAVGATLDDAGSDAEWVDAAFFANAAQGAMEGQHSIRGERTTESELDTLCLEHIARFKRPRVYYFIDELLKNNYGKVLKTELRMRLENHK